MIPAVVTLSRVRDPGGNSRDWHWVLRFSSCFSALKVSRHELAMVTFAFVVADRCCRWRAGYLPS
jgi:hypothetical protein